MENNSNTRLTRKEIREKMLREGLLKIESEKEALLKTPVEGGRRARRMQLDEAPAENAVVDTKVEKFASEKKDTSKKSERKLVEKKTKEVSKKNKFKRIFLTVTIPLFLLLAAGSYFFLNSTSIPVADSVYDPSSKDENCEVFTQFEECSIIFEANDDVPRNGLISQSVPAGWTLYPPKKIELIYSKGPKTSAFPDIIKKTYEEAEKELYVLGLEVGEVTSVDVPDVEPNRIISANVEIGATVKNGQKINLEISSELVDLPSIVGLTREQAELDLDELGIESSFEEEESDEPQGTVIKQSKEPGKLAKGSKITVTIAKPYEVSSIKIPNVVGLSETEAQSLIATAGFRNIAVVKIETSKATEEKVGYVVPGEGRTVRSDSNIVLIVTIPEKTV